MVFDYTMNDILIGIIKNAIEFSLPNNKVVLRSKRSGNHCLIDVVDFGEGVNKEHISRLFQPFFSTTKNGYGLTLSSGRKVMQSHEGDLLYFPGEGSGSVFQLVVPLENRDSNIDQLVTDVKKKLT